MNPDRVNLHVLFLEKAKELVFPRAAVVIASVRDDKERLPLVAGSTHFPDGQPKQLKRPRRILTDAEFVKLLTRVPEEIQLLIKTAVSTGMRISEMTGLRWGRENYRQRVQVLCG